MTIPTGFKPLLAINYDSVKTQPEVRYCSPKLNGVRMIVFGGVGYSRSLKPLPNKQLQEYCKNNAVHLEGLDGEIIVGDNFDNDVLSKTVSFVMSVDKVDHDWKFNVFDKYHDTLPWLDRYSIAEQQIKLANFKSHDLNKLSIVEHFWVREKVQPGLITYAAKLPWVSLELYEQSILEQGGEGLVIRDALGKYKTGRSGKIKPELQKMKKFSDSEYRIVGYFEEQQNTNEATTSETGNTKRSTAKEGMKPKGTLGGFKCVTAAGDVFGVGSGFTAEQRKELWVDVEQHIGKLAKVQYFGVGNDKVPLLPVFLGFRDEIDT